jgi:predicted nucleotidyltransferase
MVTASNNEEIIALLKMFLQALKNLNIEFEDAYLYGSYAKGAATGVSDIDIAIVARDWMPDIIEAQYELMKTASRIDSRIEPHPFRKADFNASNPFARDILTTGKMIKV